MLTSASTQEKEFETLAGLGTSSGGKRDEKVEIKGSFTMEENTGKSHLNLGRNGEMDLETTLFMPRKAPNILTWWQQCGPWRLTSLQHTPEI